MSDSEDTWENFFGNTTELLPTIMSTLDALLINQQATQPLTIDVSNGYDSDDGDAMKSSSPKRPGATAGTFSNNLSPNVQKLLSHLADDEIANSCFASHDNLLAIGKSHSYLATNRQSSITTTSNRNSFLVRSQRLHKSTDALEDIISPNVQKILSNLQDTDLVINCTGVTLPVNNCREENTGESRISGNAVNMSLNGNHRNSVNLNSSHSNSVNLNSSHSNGVNMNSSHSNSVNLNSSHSNGVNTNSNHSNSVNMNSNHSNSVNLNSNHSNNVNITSSHSNSVNTNSGNSVNLNSSHSNKEYCHSNSINSVDSVHNNNLNSVHDNTGSVHSNNINIGEETELLQDSSDLSLISAGDSGTGDSLLNKSNSVHVMCNGGDTSTPPLGSYLHYAVSSSGVAPTRTPVGRGNMGKYLQIPSGSTNSTVSSEVSRPVSLTSLGSCSSSGSSGMHQPCSTYLASAESLDSDPEPANSQGSADSGIAESNTSSPELRVIQEVLDTENRYVHDLKQVIDGYLEPWRNEPDCPLQEHLTHLFGNLEEIYTFNRAFLRQLKTANYDPTLTANVFLQNDNGFTCYTEYCTNYPRTMAILSDLTRDEKMAALIREKQIALGHNLQVGSYLLKPVQRILKYRLLLQRLSKHCTEHHRPAVDLALTTMTAVATHINNMKRRHEHAVRVHEIQSQLVGWPGETDAPPLTALGELIAEGAFRVNGARGRRHVFLFERVLVLSKWRPVDGVFAYKSHIMCSNLMLVEQVRGEPLSFHILPFDNPRLQCTLSAKSPQHKREWTSQLKKVIIENYSAVIPKHAQLLVMQLGQDMPELDEDGNNSEQRWSPLKQQHHSPPQYLERNKTRARQSSRHISTSTPFSNRRTGSHDRSFTSLAAHWRRKSDPSGGAGGPITSLLPAMGTPRGGHKNSNAPNHITDISTPLAAMKRKGNYGDIMQQQQSKDSGTRFYMDLSDGEEEEEEERVTGNGVRTSMESVATVDEERLGEQEKKVEEVDGKEDGDSSVASSLEMIVSDLLLSNGELQKMINKKPRRRHRLLSREPADVEEREIWTKQQQDKENNSHLPTKADSLPRSFLLNDRLDIKEESFASNGSIDNEEQHETDVSSQIDEDPNYPDCKIYRKSAVRNSILHRFRALLWEHQRSANSAISPPRIPPQNTSNTNISSPTIPEQSHKQGSRSMGAKIANPDYADPQEIFASMAQNNTTKSPNIDDFVDDYRLDRSEMTINEEEVFEALNERLQRSSLQVDNEIVPGPISPREDYYERLFDQKLHEEDLQRGLAKSDSFRDKVEVKKEEKETEENGDSHNGNFHINTAVKLDNFEDKQFEFFETTGLDVAQKTAIFERQSSGGRSQRAPPPPIPAKPKFLSQKSQFEQQENSNFAQQTEGSMGNSKGWVKTIVDRFE